MGARQSGEFRPFGPVNLPDILIIPFVFVKFVRGRTVRRFATYNSALLFTELRRAALRGFGVGVMREDGRILDADSLLSLNAYLRTAALPRGGVFPFSRCGIRGETSRYGWRMFKGYLDLVFL